MRSWLGEGTGFRIALVEAVDIRPSGVAAVLGIVCSDPLLGSHMFDDSPL